MGVIATSKSPAYLSRSWLAAVLSFAIGAPAAASKGKAAGEDPVAAILKDAGGGYHLEQHPDTSCRRDWRNDDLTLGKQAQRYDPKKLVEVARGYLGKAYRYGGTGKGGLDCSAFVNRVFAAFGYDLPRTSREQFEVGLEVSRNELKEGDLVFFSERAGRGRISHVGVYVGDGKMVHASSGRNEVVEDSLALKWYARRFAGARRIAVLPPGRYSDSAGHARAGMRFKRPGQVRRSLDIGPCTETDYSRPELR